MSAIANYFKSNGKNVAGYDKVATDITNSLQEIGIAIYAIICSLAFINYERGLFQISKSGRSTAGSYTLLIDALFFTPNNLMKETLTTGHQHNRVVDTVVELEIIRPFNTPLSLCAIITNLQPNRQIYNKSPDWSNCDQSSPQWPHHPVQCPDRDLMVKPHIHSPPQMVFSNIPLPG